MADELHEKIRQAQVAAGEKVVCEYLEKSGLLKARAPTDEIAKAPLMNDLINQIPANLQWLIRTDEEKGYFVNITDMSFALSLGREGFSSRAYGATIEEALSMALSNLPARAR
jgi:hypothetical protein